MLAGLTVAFSLLAFVLFYMHTSYHLIDSQVFQFFNVSAPANATLNDLAQTPDLTIAGSLKAQRVVVNTTSGEVQLQDTQLVTAGGQSLPMGMYICKGARALARTLKLSN